MTDLPRSGGSRPPTCTPYNSPQSSTPSLSSHYRPATPLGPTVTSSTLPELEDPMRCPSEDFQPVVPMTSSNPSTSHRYPHGQTTVNFESFHTMPPLNQVPICPDTLVSLWTRTELPPANADHIKVTFPPRISQGGSFQCPFRLLDCVHFCQTGQLAVWQFNGNPCLQAEVATLPRFEEIKKWRDFECIFWVAVSYDDSDSAPNRGQAESGVRIRYDLLERLCTVAMRRFQVRFLWLDKLCVFQDSEREMGTWRMPGHMKWAFGLAKGTLVLLNGLQDPLPLKPLACGYPVPAPTSDLAGSLRVFLELAFSANLREVVVPFIYRSDATAEADPPISQGKTITVHLEEFLKHTIESLAPREPEPGDGQAVIGTDTLSEPARAALVAQIQALLAPLSFRDHLRSYYATNDPNTDRGTAHPCHLSDSSEAPQAPSVDLETPSTRECRSDHNPMLVIAHWEEAIWRNILFYRTAGSSTQLVFGLAWLLQDLCDVQRHPARASTPDLISTVLHRMMESRGLDKLTGETRYPMVWIGLTLVVSQFNEISGPSSKVAVQLSEEKGQTWKVPLPPAHEWMGFKATGPDPMGQPTSTSYPQASGPGRVNPVSQSNHVEIGWLELNVVSHHELELEGRRPVFALRVTHLTHENMLPVRNEVKPIVANSQATVEVYTRSIPLGTWTTQGTNGVLENNVLYLKLQQHLRPEYPDLRWDWEYWQIVGASIKTVEKEISWVPPPPEECTRQSCQLTPQGALREHTPGN